MALRYAIEVAGEDYRPKTHLRRLPAVREPDVRYFVPETKAKVVAAELLARPMLDVCAAVGAGKSTRLPTALALKSKTTVLLVVPNRLLAVQLYDYMETKSDEGDSVPGYLYEDGQPIPQVARNKPCIVYIGAAQLVACLLRDLDCLKDKVVFLDEAHESDAYSYLLRTVGTKLGARNVIRASATFSPDTTRMRRTPSKVERLTYDPDEDISEWDPRDASKPWYYSQDHNILVFSDSLSASKRLAAAYAELGCRSHILRADTSVSRFRAAVEDTYNDELITVLILDYSFRSGFTFNASLILDTGIVRYMSGKLGDARYMERSIYSFEEEQTAGRIGRIPGLDGRYYRPKATLEKTRVDLEGVELEAVAYLCRVMGFLPIPAVDKALMARYDLPADITFDEAMNGAYPLTYYLPTSKVKASYTVVDETADKTVPSSDASASVVPRSRARSQAAESSDRPQPRVSSPVARTPAKVPDARKSRSRASSVAGKDHARRSHSRSSTTTGKERKPDSAKGFLDKVADAFKSSDRRAEERSASRASRKDRRNSVSQHREASKPARAAVEDDALPHRTKKASASKSEQTRTSVPRSSPGSSKSTSTALEARNKPDILEKWGKCLEDGAMEGEGSFTLEEGKYYYPPWIPRDVVNTRNRRFPKGCESVLNYLSKVGTTRSVRRRLGEQDWQYALAISLQRYNMLVVEADSMRRGLEMAAEDNNFDPGLAGNRVIVENIYNELKDVESSRRELFHAIGQLVSAPEDVCQFPGAPHVFDARVETHYNRYSGVMGSQLKPVTPAAYAKDFAEGLDGKHPRLEDIKGKTVSKVNDDAVDADFKIGDRVLAPADPNKTPAFDDVEGWKKWYADRNRAYPYAVGAVTTVGAVQTYGLHAPHCAMWFGVWPVYQPMVVLSPL